MGQPQAGKELELPNLVSILADKFHGTAFSGFLHRWENIIFSLIAIIFLILAGYLASKNPKLIPARLQSLFEIFVSATDDFICGILGKKGRKFVPFIGTLFIFIITMNIMGMIPFLKSPTSSWSITLALSLCVFIYVQSAALKDLGFVGYFDHLLGKPRGILAVSVIIPLLMFFLHIISELVKPISLSLRLRSNIWGDDVLLAVLAGFGVNGVPLILFSFFLMLIAAVVQATVFCLLTTIYFAIFLEHD